MFRSITLCCTKKREPDFRFAFSFVILLHQTRDEVGILAWILKRQARDQQ